MSGKASYFRKTARRSLLCLGKAAAGIRYISSKGKNHGGGSHIPCPWNTENGENNLWARNGDNMSISVIDGKVFTQMLIGGTAVLANHAEELNALNVFPVSDGDTGTNMRRTMEGGLSQIRREPIPQSIGAVSGRFAAGTLLGARGNSGVILSQIFAGINEILTGLETADLSILASAYRRGIETAYAAVQNPTEGTILTVFRESAEYAANLSAECSCIEDFFRYHIEKAKISLASTPELLHVLKEANVVDSGAAGYLYIAKGMYEALCGEPIEMPSIINEPEEPVHIERFTRDQVLEYGYCTEFLLRLTTSKVDVDAFDMQKIQDDLKELNGESIVAYRQDDVIKVHVHTFTPGRVLDRMQTYGEFLTVKIENMMLGHTQSTQENNKPAKPYSIVATASGDGMAALLSDLGADQVICSDSPSTEDFFEACRRCETRDVFVLPNHKNCFLAADQAAKLLPQKKIRVIQTQNDAEGFSALSVMTPGIVDMDALLSSAERAAQDVITGDVTAAIRDAQIDGVTIRCGEYLARKKGSLVAVAPLPEEAVLQFLANVDIMSCELLTLFCGKTVTPDRREELAERIGDLYPDLEVTVYEGGQDVFDYYIALE